MTLSQLLTLIVWDMRVNRGLSLDSLRAKLLLLEFRVEQYVYHKTHNRANVLTLALWYRYRLFGSVFQWALCNSNIPGSLSIGRGLRLPHPQNIVVTGFAAIGEFCTIYHNVTIAWNGFNGRITPELSPKIGDRVLVGTGAILIGDITIGSDVLVGAGVVVAQSVPDRSRVTSTRPTISPRGPSAEAAEPGSEQHIRDPYSLWR
jgi:serine O-acetyltransferase